jgi:DNA polymerase (family X)
MRFGKRLSLKNITVSIKIIMTNKEIAKKFQQLGQLMEFWDDNPFKIKSYAAAYILLRKLDTPVATMTDAEMLAIKGIGASIVKGIRELLANGSLSATDAFAAKMPAGVMEMLALSGYGPKKIKQLWEGLGVESLGELLYACEENRLVALKGFGEKSQQDIKQKVVYLQNAKGKMLYANAERIANHAISALKKTHHNLYLRITGELRRRCPIVESIELLTISDAVYLETTVFPNTDFKILDKGEDWFLLENENDIKIKLWYCKRDNLGSKLFKTTGSTEFLRAFLAASTEATGATDFTNIGDEEDVFMAGGVPFIIPEMRENDRWLGEDQPKLLDITHIKGVLHTHTTYSDGLHTLREMAEHAREEGFRYIGITDHSQSAFYANGLKPNRVLEQWTEIDNLNGFLAPFKIYKGIECDILNDGSLDYDDDFLAQFDFVIASVHSNLRMDEAKATERLIKAIENPNVHILGHPTGRLLLARPGYPINHAAVIDACALHKVAIELNANPNRLDIDWTWISYAVQKGVKIAINPDAHSIEGINDIRYGVYAARKGGLPFYSCVNAMQRDEFEKWMKKRKTPKQ